MILRKNISWRVERDWRQPENQGVHTPHMPLETMLHPPFIIVTAGDRFMSLESSANMHFLFTVHFVV